MKKHPADETRWSIFLHGGIPAIIAVVVVLISAFADVSHPGNHWTQRAGAVTTVLGAYVAYVDTVRANKFIDGCLYMNHKLPYKWISVLLVVAGTSIWGYGDLVL